MPIVKKKKYHQLKKIIQQLTNQINNSEQTLWQKAKDSRQQIPAQEEESQRLTEALDKAETQNVQLQTQLTQLQIESQRLAELLEKSEQKNNLLNKEHIKHTHTHTERERERESKIEELRKRIAKLEAIVNRTPKEEQELQEKKQELAELENQPQSGGDGDPKKPTNYWPWIIGGGIILILIIGIIAFLWGKQNSKKEKPPQYSI